MPLSVATWPGRLACALFLLAGAGAWAQPATLSGPVVDHGFADHPQVCCVDVAAVNLLNYADRQPGHGDLVPDGRPIGDQQLDFHKLYDPALARNTASTADLVKGLKDTFSQRGFQATVKSFGTNQLSLATLYGEWDAGEYLILNMREVGQGFGHSVFLWGIDRSDETPRLGVADPNIEPNTDPATGAGGAVSWSELGLGTDDRGFPDWRLRYGDDPAYHYRILSLVSVSDISPVPEPATWTLLAAGVAVIGAAHRRRPAAPHGRGA